MALWVPDGKTKPDGPGYGRKKNLSLTLHPIPLCFLAGLFHWQSMLLTSLFSPIQKAQISPSDLVQVLSVARNWSLFWVVQISSDDFKKSNKVGVPELRRGWLPGPSGVPLISSLRGSSAWRLKTRNQEPAYLVHVTVSLCVILSTTLCPGFLTCKTRIIIAPIS